MDVCIAAVTVIEHRKLYTNYVSISGTHARHHKQRFAKRNSPMLSVNTKSEAWTVASSCAAIADIGGGEGFTLHVTKPFIIGRKICWTSSNRSFNKLYSELLSSRMATRSPCVPSTGSNTTQKIYFLTQLASCVNYVQDSELVGQHHQLF